MRCKGQVHFSSRISALRFWVTGSAARLTGKSLFGTRFACWNPAFFCARCAFGSPPAQRLRKKEEALRTRGVIFDNPIP